MNQSVFNTVYVISGENIWLYVYVVYVYMSETAYSSYTSADRLSFFFMAVGIHGNIRGNLKKKKKPKT